MIRRGCHSVRSCARFLAARYIRIVPAIVAFLLVWLFFSRWDSTIEQDRYLLMVMSAGFLLTVGMMLRYNVGWPPIDVGILFLCLASATIWWFFADSIANRRRITETENDIVRALFVTALIILFTAYPWWIYQRRRNRESVEWDGVTERRHGPGRRSVDKRASDPT